nr:hypothetical protein [Tanacetum cinerariifolium]
QTYNNTNRVNATSTPVTTVGTNSTNSANTFSAAGPSNTAVCPTLGLVGKSLFMDPSQYPDDPNMPPLEDITYSDDEEDVGVEADFSNLETNMAVVPIPITRVHKGNLVTQSIGDLSSAPQTRSMIRMVKEQDPSWIEAMQEVLLQFKMQKVWVLVDLPKGHTHKEGIDYGEVFPLVARIEAIRLFLAYASFMGFMVYQMDVKSAFLYGTTKEEVYVCQPPRFEDPDYPNKVYKVVKALFGLHEALRAWITSKAKQDGIFISQDKYVAEILRKFGLTDGKSANTPIDTEKPLLKDHDVAYSDSDYAGASLDKKSITGDCQFLGCRLISWQCKKQIVVATSSTEAEYVAVASCCAQVLWIQN